MSLPVRLVFCALTMEMSVSANLLTWLGVPYVTDGGAFPLKIHPGTYFVGLAFLMMGLEQAASARHFTGGLGKVAHVNFYLGAVIFCMIHVTVMTGMCNLIVLLDTFLPAGLMAALLHDATPLERRSLRCLLQSGIAFNAVLALGEAALHANVIPLYLNDAEYHAAVEDFRPTALYDHPLTGGLMTMMGVALAPARFLLRVPYTILQIAAALAFGGRMAVAAIVLSGFVLAGIQLGRDVLRRDRRSAVHLICLSLISLGFFGLAAGAICAGFGARLAGHLYWDQSAQVRLAQWDLIGELSVPHLLFGTSRHDFLALLNILWLSKGVEVVENFWLLMFVSLGLPGFLIFVAGFFSLLRWCWNHAALQGRVMLAAFMFVASTSNSLGHKSMLLVVFVAAMSCCPGREATATKAARYAVTLRSPSSRLVGAA